MSSAQQPLSLKHTEAQARAALLDVTAYDVALDLDRGDETFGSVSTITVRSQGVQGLRSSPQAKLSSTTTPFGMAGALSRRSKERSVRPPPGR